MPLPQIYELVDGRFVPGGLVDGKVVPGRSWLRDLQTGTFDLVESVDRAEDISSSPYINRGATQEEVNALNGGGRIHSAQGRS